MVSIMAVSLAQPTECSTLPGLILPPQLHWKLLKSRDMFSSFSQILYKPHGELKRILEMQ